MSIHQKAYRYRLLPTPEQEGQFWQFAGARRWTYNWALARRLTHYKTTGKSLSVSELCGELTQLKHQPETAWLREMDSQLLQQAIRDLDKAFGAFFARRTKFPCFRSKKRETPRFRIPQRVVLVGDRLSVPKVGLVRLVLHRPLEGTVKSATFKRDATGAWYVTLVVHFELSDTPLPPPDAEQVVGVDVGLKDLAVLSNGQRVPAPRHYRRAERKLRRLQRHLSRCERGSKNREKARMKVARQHRRVANQRADHLHKLTSRLVREHDAVVLEDLNVKGLGRTNLAKSVHDAGWSMLRFQLAYKARWQRKHLVVIGRFFPSSRLCAACGCINSDLTLADREWTCRCGVVHDRDLNAARNIRDEGLRLLLAEGCPESIINASRALVTPATRRLDATTEEAQR
ncbi:MAG TPA: transposase [Chloroflexaceae bacterium]|nr:transposase [Chloroflexaceae bacterium]